MKLFKNSLELSHKLIKEVLNEGDVVVDATCGNGNDTCFLAELVGDTGKVYAFDIQNEALSRTKNKLEILNIYNRVEIINDGHENMHLHISTNVKAVMFNLGYMPGGDHSITTKPETTIIAIERAMQILESGGIITLVIYYGKDSGPSEKEQVLEFLKEIDQKKFTVLKTEFINHKNCSPVFTCIEKL